MKPGRNDPCPCGSGKKYKKCCLEKDRQAERAAAVSLSPPPTVPSPARAAPPLPSPRPTPEPEPDPRIEAFDARWKDFEAADYAGRLALFEQTLAEPDLMDGEMAFEMLNLLHPQAAEHDERHRFDELVEALRRQLPNVYDEEAKYLLPWRIENALATDRQDAVATLSRELARIADRAIDPFFTLVDQLAYHGERHVLMEIIPIAWPRLKQSNNVVVWAMDELAARMGDLLVFDYLKREGSPETVPPELVERIEAYTKVDLEWFTPYLLYLTGRANRHWTMEEFAFAPLSRRSAVDDEEWDEDEEEWDEDEEGEEEVKRRPAGKKPKVWDPARQNLLSLTTEFLGWLRREENVPYTKGELAREQIFRYILDRFDGDLEPRPSPLEAALNPRKARAKPKPRPPAHLLCPDRDTLDRRLGILLDFLNPQRYKAAAFFEMIPAWLRFLESRGLIDEEQRGETLQDVFRLHNTLVQMWQREPGDPALRQALANWGAVAAPDAAG